jgi:ubiquinone/menaquinone biosynthesis C-methylase UbiE
MREYDLIADWYATDRGETVGVAEALAVAATLPAGSCILDVGCGNGVPITEALVKAGHRVVGLDTYTGMLARFRVNLPRTPAVRGDVRNCPFSHGSFDAAVSWGMMFTTRAAISPQRSKACRACSNLERRFSSRGPTSMAPAMPVLQAP